jgi:hypothetical protein
MSNIKEKEDQERQRSINKEIKKMKIFISLHTKWTEKQTENQN